MAAGRAAEMEFVDAADAVFRGAGGELGGEVRRQHLGERAADGTIARNFEKADELGIPGLDAVLEVESQDADVQGFDDIFAEIFEALDLSGFLFERVIETRVLDGDADVASDGEQQLEIVAGEVIAADGFGKAENGGGAVVEATGDEVI